MFKRISFIIIFVGMIALTGCAPKGGTAGSASDLPDVIKIGFVGPLTGGLGSLGQDDKAAIELYFKENPTINGKPVEVIWEDGKCNGQDAANAAQKLITIDKVQAILGGQCSGEMLASAPIAEANKVVMLSSTASSPEITTAGDYIFRNYISDAQVSKTMVDYMLPKHEKIAIIAEQTDYAQAFAKGIAKHMEEAGASDKLVINESFSVDNADFRTLLVKVKESGADALVAMGQSPISIGFIAKQAREMGLNVQIYGSDTLPATDFFDIAKDAGEGAIAVLASEDPSRAGFSEFQKKFLEKYGNPQSTYAIPAFGYDGAAVLSKGIGEAGYNGTAIKDYFYNMPKFVGIGSDVKFDVNGDNDIQASIKIARNGEFVFLK